MSLQYTDFDDSTAVVAGATYTYDDNGNVETFTPHVGTGEVYEYDSLDRLKAVNDVSYIYDAIGNIESVSDPTAGTTTYHYDHPNGLWPHAVRAAGDYVYTYNQRGAVETRENLGTGAHQLFGYMGALDLPKRIETTQAGAVTATELEYSPFGERVIKRARAPDNTILSEIQYVGDVMEVHHHPDDSYEYVYNIFVGGSQIARVTLVEQTPGGALSDSTVEFLLNDALGTPRTVTNSDGDVLRTQHASPFGQMPVVEGPGFTGHRHDQDLGLIDMRGRLYDPAVSRFMQADPITSAPYLSEGLNPYSYTFNSPTNWVDPSGLSPVTPPEKDTITGCPGGCGPNGGPPPQGETHPPPSPDGGTTPSQSSAGAQAGVAAEHGAATGGGYDPRYGGYTPNSPFPPGGGQWGPGNQPGDIAPSQDNGQSQGGAEPLKTGEPPGGPGPNLVFDPDTYSYGLTPSTAQKLKQIFQPFGFDPGQVSFAFGSDTATGGNRAFTVGNSVIINRSEWATRTPVQQRALLVHEITHSVQYARYADKYFTEAAGIAAFLARYATEYPRGDNYKVPKDTLGKISVQKLNPIDSRFTLDQIANRVRDIYLGGPSP